MSENEIRPSDILRIFYSNQHIGGTPLEQIDLGSFDWDEHFKRSMSRDFDRDRFFEDWHNNLSLNPWQFLTSPCERLLPNDRITVVAHPAVGLRDRMGRNLDPIYKNGYEIPLPLISEDLDEHTSPAIQSAVLVVKRLHHLELLESRANQFAFLFLIYIHLCYVEEAAARLGMTSILKRGSLANCEWSQSQLLRFNEWSVEQKLELLLPLGLIPFSIEAVLDSWQKFGQRLAAEDKEKLRGQEGLWLYSMLPPTFKTFEEIERGFKEAGLNFGTPYVSIPYQGTNLANAVKNGTDTDTSELPSQFAGAIDSSIIAPQVVDDNTCLFRRSGEVWTIAYAGKLFLMRDQMGFKYLKVLLSHPGKSFHIQEIVNLTEGKSLGTASEILGQMSDNELEESGLYKEKLDETVALSDNKSRKDVMSDLKQLQEEISLDEFISPEDRLITIQKVDMLKSYLRSSKGFGGRDRPFPTESERLRSSIKMAIGRAIKRIGRFNPTLSQHLDICVKTGMHCSYTPDRPVNWEQ